MMQKLKCTLLCVVVLLMLAGSSSRLFAAYPVPSQQASQVPKAVVAEDVATQAAKADLSIKSSVAQPAEFESVKAKGRQDPGVLSFILSMVALVVLALGGIIGGLLFPLLSLIPAGFGIYYGVKGFNRTNKGFAIAGFVISILVALTALGRIL